MNTAKLSDLTDLTVGYIQKFDDVPKRDLKNRVHESKDLKSLIKTYHDLSEGDDGWISSADKNHDSNIKFILTGDGSPDIKKSQVIIKKPVVMTTSMILEKEYGSDKAVALAKQIPNLTIGSLKLEMNELMRVTKVHPESYNIVIRKIIETLLLGWRDPVVAEVKAREAFNSVIFYYYDNS